MLGTPTPVLEYLFSSTKKLAVLWKIERKDGVPFYFTNHDSPLIFQSNQYNPAGGADASARRAVDALRDNSVEFRGGISSDMITVDDLRAGRFSQAKITEYIVNWRTPFLGPITTQTYWVDGTTNDAEVWIAECTGPERFTKRKISEVFSRNCRNKLGDHLCQVTLSSFTTTGTVLGTEDGGKRLIMFADPLSMAPFLDGDFDYGQVTFTTGANANLTRLVKIYTASFRRFELQEPFPHEMVFGDAFEAIQGCDKLRVTCDGKFSNRLNFGGFLFIPGTDRIITTPAAR